MYNESTPFDAPTITKSTRFLDWFHEKARTVWEEGLFDLWDNVPYDGLWLDMNAPTISCDGGPPLCTAPTKERTVKHEPSRRKLGDDLDTSWYSTYGPEFMAENSTYYLPFIPQTANLDRWTITLNATHTNSSSGKTYLEYDVHSLFGHMQAKTTADILNSNKSNNGQNPNADYRKLISSTSTFAGTGKYAQHHRAGQRRTWDHLKYSIAHVMNFNMFGMPFTGADVCGSKWSHENQTTEE